MTSNHGPARAKDTPSAFGRTTSSTRRRMVGAALLAALGLSGCASATLTSGAALSSKDRLGDESGTFGKRRSFADAEPLASAKTVRIIPTSFAAAAAGKVRNPADRALVANALDRSVCIALSDKYEIVEGGRPADLTVRTVVTGLVPTDKIAAGASVAVSLGSSFVLPVSVPRLPLGLGSLTVEGEAVDAKGTQRAAMVWAKGANAITSNPRVSEVGDAYGLAASYADDFAALVIKGKEPPTLNIGLPSGQRVRSFFGGRAKFPACETFGRQPGVPGFVAGFIGAPPEWTDDGAKRRAGAQENIVATAGP